MADILTAAFFSPVLLLGAVVAAESAKTRRLRLLSGLPLPARTLGMSRHYGSVVGRSTWMALLFLSSRISHRGRLGLDSTWWRPTKIGSLFILAADLYFCAKHKGFQFAVLKWLQSA